MKDHGPEQSEPDGSDPRVAAYLARLGRRDLLAAPADRATLVALHRAHVGQLAEGGCLEFAVAFQRVGQRLPRDNH